MAEFFGREYVEQLSTGYVGGDNFSGVVDTLKLGLRRIALHVEWQFSVAPASLTFTLVGSNDPSYTTPSSGDVSLPLGTYSDSLSPSGADGLSPVAIASGKAVIFVTALPRFVAVKTTVGGGSFTGAISVRTFSWSE